MVEQPGKILPWRGTPLFYLFYASSYGQKKADVYSCLQ
jgi:hypothetical protein